DVKAFVGAVESVARGGTALDREVVSELVRRKDPDGGDGALAAPPPPAKEGLGLVAGGRPDTAIARAPVVPPRRGEKHIPNIFSKLDLPATDEDHRRVLAVLAFLRGG